MKMGSTTIVQYVIIRGDLLKVLNWPIGAVITQACHGVTACIHRYHNDDNVKTYLNDLDNMHKVVLEAKDEDSLMKLKDQLIANQIDHYLWIEQPENIPTCLVVKPYRKDDVQKYFKKFKLMKL